MNLRVYGEVEYTRPISAFFVKVDYFLPVTRNRGGGNIGVTFQNGISRPQMFSGPAVALRGRSRVYVAKRSRELGGFGVINEAQFQNALLLRRCEKWRQGVW